MKLAKVVGTTVSTIKESQLVGLKLLVCVPCSTDGVEEKEDRFVAVDTVGAGRGEVILVALGSAARATERTKQTPSDATVVGIVDFIELNGETTYRKGG